MISDDAVLLPERLRVRLRLRRWPRLATLSCMMGAIIVADKDKGKPRISSRKAIHLAVFICIFRLEIIRKKQCHIFFKNNQIIDAKTRQTLRRSSPDQGWTHGSIGQGQGPAGTVANDQCWSAHCHSSCNPAHSAGGCCPSRHSARYNCRLASSVRMAGARVCLESFSPASLTNSGK